MHPSAHQPAFGEADLSNCERELIHLPGSVQPHGALLVLDTDARRVIQASTNTGAILGIDHARLLATPVAELEGTLAGELDRLLRDDGVGLAPRPFRARVGAAAHAFEVVVHRVPAGNIVVELEPGAGDGDGSLARQVTSRLAEAVTRIGSAPTLAVLAERAVQTYREIAGYDRVMVYRFDPDGHGEVIAEAKKPELEPYLGLNYPASDIPQRARELYLRNRVRVLVDVDYEPVPLQPRLNPATGDEVDMSMCWLRSMSPLHLQYLRNMGVTATLVASLVRDDELWGLIACHHYSPKRVPYVVRAACDLVSELITARLAVLQNFSHVRSEAMVRRLETRLIEATSVAGDWRRALFDDPRTLLDLADATGAALAFDGEILTSGRVPGTSDLRRLFGWIRDQPLEGRAFVSDRIPRAAPALADMADSACGVVAVEIDRTAGEYLLFLRGERVHEVRWAGDPRKPVLIGNDPLQLSPRRSFAVWTEQVRGTSRPWRSPELGTARAAGAALRDVALQVRSMSLLIAEDRIRRVRGALQNSEDGIVIADANGRVLLANETFSRMFQRPHVHLGALEELVLLVKPPEEGRAVLRALTAERRNWRGVLSLEVGEGNAVPVALRADVVLRPEGGVLGYIVLITDMRAQRDASAARDRLQRAILEAQRPLALSGLTADDASDFGDLIRAVLSTASVAVMEIATDSAAPAAVPFLDALEASTRRVAVLTRQVIAYSRDRYDAS